MHDKILTHRDMHGDLDNFVKNIRRRMARRGRVQGQDDRTVQAEINHGRWIARCTCCSGAEMVDPDDPRFFCLSCDNSECGCQWMRVEFPPPARRASIEVELMKRPNTVNRNWHPGESVKKLRAENKENGVI